MGQAAQKLTKSVRDVLAMHGWLTWKGGSTAGRNKQGDFYRTGTPGSPDIYAVKGQRYVLIEVKTTDSLRPSQRAFQAEIERVGGVYLVVRSCDDIVNFLNGVDNRKAVL